MYAGALSIVVVRESSSPSSSKGDRCGLYVGGGSVVVGMYDGGGCSNSSEGKDFHDR